MSAVTPTISTHVLDTERGRPAVGVAVELIRTDGGERRVGAGQTDADGRIARLVDGQLEAGEYRLRFRLEGPFLRELSVTFSVTDTSRSYHVPLLIAPYSATTYRGS
jgi:5-hydroxyisourate hydrolase